MTKSVVNLYMKKFHFIFLAPLLPMISIGGYHVSMKVENFNNRLGLKNLNPLNRALFTIIKKFMVMH